ncbi:MAG: TIGR01458 family HAD-type hydrolase [Rubrobacteraceae bacterium]
MREDLLKEVKGLLLDLDGTLYTNAGPIEGAPEVLRRISESGIPYRYLTNATHKSRREVTADLREMGFSAEEKQILTPATAIVGCLREEKAGCHALVNESLLEDLEGVRTTDDSPGYVLVGNLGDGFTYVRLNEAFRHLMAGAGLISLLENRYWQAADGAFNLDAGPFVAALEYASGKKAQCVGKPSSAFYERAVEDLGLSSGEVAMIGDDLQLDVAGAQAAGIIGVLVESGRPRPEDPSVRPDLVLKSVAQLPEALGLLGSGAVHS